MKIIARVDSFTLYVNPSVVLKVNGPIPDQTTTLISMDVFVQLSSYIVINKNYLADNVFVLVISLLDIQL